MINILNLINHRVAMDESNCSQHKNVPHKSEFSLLWELNLLTINNRVCLDFAFNPEREG